MIKSPQFSQKKEFFQNKLIDNIQRINSQKFQISAQSPNKLYGKEAKFTVLEWKIEFDLLL